MRLTYLIGPPGAGKTTLINALTNGVPRYASTSPFAKTIYPGPGVVQLGEERPPFSGTDTLSMSVQPKVLGWAVMPEYSDVLGEGDRLSTGGFFAGMRDLGYDLCVVHCVASPEVTAARRAVRADGSQLKAQDPAWVKGRLTKVARLADSWATHQLDMDRPLGAIVADAALLPVLEALWEARS